MLVSTFAVQIVTKSYLINFTLILELFDLVCKYPLYTEAHLEEARSLVPVGDDGSPFPSPPDVVEHISGSSFSHKLMK